MNFYGIEVTALDNPCTQFAEGWEDFAQPLGWNILRRNSQMKIHSSLRLPWPLPDQGCVAFLPYSLIGSKASENPICWSAQDSRRPHKKEENSTWMGGNATCPCVACLNWYDLQLGKGVHEPGNTVHTQNCRIPRLHSSAYRRTDNRAEDHSIPARPGNESEKAGTSAKGWSGDAGTMGTGWKLTDRQAQNKAWIILYGDSFKRRKEWTMTPATSLQLFIFSVASG